MPATQEEDQEDDTEASLMIDTNDEDEKEAAVEDRLRTTDRRTRQRSRSQRTEKVDQCHVIKKNLTDALSPTNTKNAEDTIAQRKTPPVKSKRLKQSKSKPASSASKESIVGEEEREEVTACVRKDLETLSQEDDQTTETTETTEVDDDVIVIKPIEKVKRTAVFVINDEVHTPECRGRKKNVTKSIKNEMSNYKETGEEEETEANPQETISFLSKRRGRKSQEATLIRENHDVSRALRRKSRTASEESCIKSAEMVDDSVQIVHAKEGARTRTRGRSKNVKVEKE